MKPTRRFVAFCVGSALVLAACTGDDDGGDGGDATGPTGVTGDDGGPTPVTGGPGDRGTYEYENAGLRVVMRIEGTAGTLEVHNGTDRTLPKPDFYILGAIDRTRVQGDVAAPEPIAAGETATFDLSFEGIEVRDIGAIALLFGRDNYGLFVRTA
jgi:hypothetical protein